MCKLKTVQLQKIHITLISEIIKCWLNHVHHYHTYGEFKLGWRPKNWGGCPQNGPKAQFGGLWHPQGEYAGCRPALISLYILTKCLSVCLFVPPPLWKGPKPLNEAVAPQIGAADPHTDREYAGWSPAWTKVYMFYAISQNSSSRKL